MGGMWSSITTGAVGQSFDPNYPFPASMTASQWQQEGDSNMDWPIAKWMIGIMERTNGMGFVTAFALETTITLAGILWAMSLCCHCWRFH